MSEESGHDQPSMAIRQHLRRALEASEYRTAEGELRTALRELEGLEEARRDDLELLVWRDYSVIAEHHNDLKTAIEYNEKLSLRRPDDAYSHLALARLYGEVGDQQKAAESLRKCSALAEKFNDNKLLAVLATKGQLPTDQDARARRLADAIVVYREALADRSLDGSPERYAGTQQLLGGLYRAQAALLVGPARDLRLEEAANAYREALKVYTPEASPDRNRALREALREVEKPVGDESN